jgi:hypothetical protein
VDVSPLFGLSQSDVEKMEAKRDIKGLIKALSYKKDYSIRQRAVQALVNIGGEQTVDTLVATLKDQDSDVRSLAVEALGKIGDARALDGLVTAVKDQDSYVRRLAVEALGKMKLHMVRVLPVLHSAFSDVDVGVREKAATAIYEFGRDSYSLTSISEEASNLMSDALKIIENQVQLQRGFSVAVGAGDSGPLMNAAGKLAAAHKLHPENPLLHYAYASGLFLAMQFKSARETMEDCAKSHPEFLLAQYAIKSWNYAEWKSLFLLPQWGPDTRMLPPVISQTVKTQIVLPVREGIRPRAALFFRDARGDFNDVEALQKAPIALATVISPVNNPQIVCVCAKICDNPSNPFIIESLQVPLHPYGHSARCTFEYFCLQEDMDLVMMGRQDRILLNKRVPFSSRMMKANMNILAMLNSSEGRTISPMELTMAIQNHQRQVSLSDVQF